MSHKISAFTSLVPTPLTKRDVTLLWPGLSQVPLLVQSFTFPTEGFDTVGVPVGGVTIDLPTHVFKPGTWSFEVPDNIFTTVRHELMLMYYGQRMFDVSMVLGNVLDVFNTSSVSGALSGLIKGTGSATSALLTAQTLCRCFIRKVDDVQFSYGPGVEQAILWRVEVGYSYIRKLTSVG